LCNAVGTVLHDFLRGNHMMEQQQGCHEHGDRHESTEYDPHHARHVPRQQQAQQPRVELPNGGYWDPECQTLTQYGGG
jgi:hypothetical protein